MSIGEVMATKDGISLSSSDSSRQINNQHEFDEDISTITSATDNKIPSICMFIVLYLPNLNTSISLFIHDIVLIAASTTVSQSQYNTPYEELPAPNKNEVVKDQKFAALTAALNDILIDDETSPSDSLISSTTSDDLSAKKEKQCKPAEPVKGVDEKDINEISPIFDVASPISHGTPTHATNSFSFSDGDGGRDFLIDDEIADQPVLCFADNQGNPNDSFAYLSQTNNLSKYLSL